MEQVHIQLTTPWPTAQGLRRPQEGLIAVSEAEAEAILDAGAGDLVDMTEAASRAQRKAKAPAKPKAAPLPAAAAEDGGAAATAE